ncbi:hypothetical protein B1808_10755 [Pseudofulvimonas gallinarii]|uniref:hypothetical protein n=1 Tax=Pseudofulvimonas gallinarii TaxID=634155 RepID=UPI000F4781B0|nr:hypothetical protein [Pseudofulvimonas gallinarii]THD12779.1 hypothetical protein B1808_10755 [Pseudofulvimonas gallinarii]
MTAGNVLEVATAGNASTRYCGTRDDSGECIGIDGGVRSLTRGETAALVEPRRVGSGRGESRRLQAVRRARQAVTLGYFRPWVQGRPPILAMSWAIRATD